MMEINEKVVVVGASGFGRETLDVLKAMQNNSTLFEVLGVLDDFPSQNSLERVTRQGYSYLGTVDEWIANCSSSTRFVIGIGNPSVRRRLAQKMEDAGLQSFSAIHPGAIIGSDTNFLPGAVICAGAVISANVRLGRHVHINPNATVGHDTILGDFVSINPAAVISGEVRVSEDVLVGANATVLQNLTIGQRSIVGAASVVTKHVPKDVVVKGVPGAWAEQ